MRKYAPIVINRERGLSIQTAYAITNKNRDYADTDQTLPSDEIGWVLPGGEVTTSRNRALAAARALGNIRAGSISAMWSEPEEGEGDED